MEPKEFLRFCEQFADYPSARQILGALSTESVARATPESLATLLLVAIEVNHTPFQHPDGRQSILPPSKKTQDNESDT